MNSFGTRGALHQLSLAGPDAGRERDHPDRGKRLCLECISGTDRTDQLRSSGEGREIN